MKESGIHKPMEGTLIDVDCRVVIIMGYSHNDLH